VIDIERAIYMRLSTDSEVVEQVSTRIYPEQVPQGTALPFITFQEIVSTPVRSFSGYSGVTRTTLQVDCWAQNYADRSAVKRSVRHALNNRNSWVGGGAIVQSVQLDSMRNSSEPPFDGGERMTRRASLDFIIYWQEEPLTE